MINFGKTQHKWSVERDVIASEIASLAAGHALVSTNSELDSEGNFKVKRSTGSASEVLDGIALDPKIQSSWTKLEAVVVPATGPYVVVLSRLAVGAIGAFKAADGVGVTVSSSAASSTNIQSGTNANGNTQLTFDSSFAGVPFVIAFSYTLDSNEQTLLMGNPYPGQSQLQAFNRVSVFKSGRIYLNNFDPTANWYIAAATPKVKVIASGLFTDGASASTGFVPSNVVIVQVPTVESPWLGLDLN